jgi:uncharacterized protein YgiM (DUF1202 family)
MPKRYLFVLVLLLASCAPKNTSAASQPTSVKTSLDAQDPTAAPVHDIEAGVVVVSSLNVRQGPGTSFPAVGSSSQGDKFYVLGETTNSTDNKWLLVRLPDNTFGWVIGERSYVTVQQETVDADTYSTWQKNVDAAKSQVLIPVTSP